MELIRKCVDKNANIEMDQGDYQQRYDALIERYETVKERLGEIEGGKQSRVAKRENISSFFASIKRQNDLLAEFDEELWHNIVESMTVNSENNAAVTFKDGTIICVNI